MNRLNNINREGIYPVTKETLLAIEDNFQMIGRVLDGLNLPDGTAVVLHGLTYNVSYMYIQGQRIYAAGKIVKVTGTGIGVPSGQTSSINNLRNNPTNFVLTPSDNKTTIIGTDGETEYEDCIVEERYTLTYSAGGNTFWKYYALEEVLGLKKEAVANNVITLPSSNWSITRNKCFIRPMLDQTHIHIDLEFASNLNLVQGKTTITIGGDIADILHQIVGGSGTYTHPLQVSATGFVASGYITQNNADTEANVICYLNGAVNVNESSQKMQITGDIWL